MFVFNFDIHCGSVILIHPDIIHERAFAGPDISSVQVECTVETRDKDELRGAVRRVQQVTPLDGQLGQVVGRVGTAGVGQPAQLVQILTVHGQGDQRVLRLRVAGGGPLAQPQLVGVTHPDTIPPPGHAPVTAR